MSECGDEQPCSDDPTTKLGAKHIPIPGNVHKQNANNLTVTALVKANLDDYKAASREKKSNIIDGVCEEIKNKRLTFVEWDDRTRKWVRVGDKRSRTLVQKRFTAQTNPSGNGKGGTKTSTQNPNGKPEARASQQVQSDADRNPNTIAAGTEACVNGSGNASSTSDTGSSLACASKPTSRPDPESPTKKRTLTINGDELHWNERVSKQKLKSLLNILTSEDGKHYLEERADDENDESVTRINGSVEIFLSSDKGGASAYHGLKKLFSEKEKTMFIPPDVLIDFLETSICNHPELRDYTMKNPAILLRYEPSQGPQPTHSDTMFQKICEMFGIFMLSEGAPGTIYYDMKCIGGPPNIDDLKTLWPSAPKKLFCKLEQNQKALKFIEKYGELLGATPDKRIEPGIVDQFSTKIFEGSHPHCAPEHDAMRAVIFLVLQPNNFKGEAYEGDTQCSHEKLLLLVYEALHDALDAPEKEFLLKLFVDALEESAKLRASDETINLGDELQPALVILRQQMATAHEAELSYDEINKQFNQASDALNEATKELQQGSMQWKQVDDDNDNASINLQKIASDVSERHTYYQQVLLKYQQALAKFNASKCTAQDRRRELNNTKYDFVMAISGADFADKCKRNLQKLLH